MKKISIALFSVFSMIAFAEVKTVEVKGAAALELFDRLERTGVQRNEWTDNQNVRHISLNIRKMVCDEGHNTEPTRTLCTILPGFMQKPIVAEREKALNILYAMMPVEDLGYTQDVYFGDCAMGKCTTDVGNVFCYFAANDTVNASCSVDSGMNY